MATFEFIVEGPAISLRSSKKNPPRYQRWISKVRAAAQSEWPTGDSLANEEIEVEVSISNYFSDEPPDIDNIIKPILDTLNGVA